LVHVIVEEMERLEASAFKVNETGSGSESYPTTMLLILPLYGYATRRIASPMTEEATYSDIMVRYSCGNRAHLDRTGVCQFQSENKEGFKDIFRKVLVMARELMAGLFR
jgi:hypothetical protein